MQGVWRNYYSLLALQKVKEVPELWGKRESRQITRNFLQILWKIKTPEAKWSGEKWLMQRVPFKACQYEVIYLHRPLKWLNFDL